ncbi:PPE family protein [Mycolicibacter icosiumassiliensis]|uniref:PPE family protein n=1 Tax=Mycolicibacter icosiumassiliensis TaxID=1792835 RepID=UPI00082A6CC0|nr:PPE family protein [Mycolicibacter icosiumassiliensis]
MLDFGALPPEVNSARMYSGPGSGPMMAATAAWEGLASQLDTASRTYSSVISALQDGGWSGAASEAMTGAVNPYLVWMTTLGLHAREAASRARTAAAAYEEAFAATVPPKFVSANRAELANLVATDFLGRNTPAIATAEAAYAEMWAQDAAAMYAYAASSAAATRLTAFTEPPQTANPGGEAGQRAAVAHAVGASAAGNAQTSVAQAMAAVPQQLQALAAGGASSTAAATTASTSSASASSLLSVFSDFNTVASPVSLAAGLSRTWTSAGSFSYAAKRDVESHLPPQSKPTTPAQPSAPAGAPQTSVPGSAGLRGAVVAELGGSTPVGGLSVPRSRAPPTSAPLLGNEPLWLPETNLAAPPSAGASPATIAATPAGVGAAAGAASRTSVSSVLRVGPRRFKMPRPAIGG